MFKVIPLILATMAPTFAQGLGADGETAKVVEMATNGGFFILAMHWMRQDAQASQCRLLDFSKDALARLEKAYASKRQPED